MRTVDARRRVIVFDTAVEMCAFAARRWEELCLGAVSERGIFTAAVSGGRTPEGFFRVLAGVPDLPWDRTHLFLVDERLVPLTDPDSNFRLLSENLLAGITIPEHNLHPVPTDNDPDRAASLYEGHLSDFFNLRPGEFPIFDLVMLGLGEDGHTASLFSDDPALKEQDRIACPVGRKDVRHARVTLTLPVLNRSRYCIFLVSGADKAKALYEVVVSGRPDLPASRVDPPDGSVLFLADSAAAGLLTT